MYQLKNIVYSVAIATIASSSFSVAAESQADRRNETPVETWNIQELELQKAIFLQQMPPTAAGPATMREHSAMGKDMVRYGQHKSRSSHSMKPALTAHEYKMKVFGSN